MPITAICPLRDYENMWAVMHNVVRDYDKIGKRNRKRMIII